MKIFYFLLFLVPCIIATCEQYATQESCLNNCWCFWRSGAWQKPDACFPISAADTECTYKSGARCTDNESNLCYAADTVVFLFKIGLFVVGAVSIVLFGTAVFVLICFVARKSFTVLEEQLIRRGLEHWITYGMTAVSVVLGLLALCAVLKIAYTVLMVILSMFGMLYESTF